MKNMQRLGGYASLLTGLGFFGIMVIDFAILAPQGFAGPDTPAEEVMALAAKSATPFQLLDFITMLFSITFILAALAVRERLGDSAPNQMLMALIAASIASALFIAIGAIDFNSTPSIAAANDVSAFRASIAITDGMLNGAIFALGWMLLLWAWAGLATKGLPVMLCYLLLLTGFAAILAFVIPILGLLVIVLNAVWGFWLGYVLLRQPKMEKP